MEDEDEVDEADTIGGCTKDNDIAVPFPKFEVEVEQSPRSNRDSTIEARHVAR